MKQTVRIGGACGFWGETDVAVPQFLKEGDLDYIVFDYLAEVTLSIMARARAKDPDMGYAPDFVHAVLKPNLAQIAAQGIKVVSNAGGLNPDACATAIRALIAKAKLDLTVAVVIGDDLRDRVTGCAASGVTEMFSGEGFPDPDTVTSTNAYLGALPIAKALRGGADIVITGRCVDSAVTLGACMHAFGWADDAHDLLSAASLAGHILECGPQATGGNFTDWEDAGDFAEIGYPIVEIRQDGLFHVTKPAGTTGTVSVGTVSEQLLYEIGDPSSYVLPDVICDFARVEIVQDGPDRVLVSGATGRPPTPDYKVSVTFADGWRGEAMFILVGLEAGKKARVFADATLERANRRLRGLNAPGFDEVHVEVSGDSSVFGQANPDAQEVMLKIAVRHADPKAVSLIQREGVGLALSAPPGLFMTPAMRPKPAPVVRLFSFLIPKAEVPVSVVTEQGEEPVQIPVGEPADNTQAYLPPDPPDMDDPVEVPLIQLAWVRSGDKGDKANLGVMPRRPDLAPYLWHGLTDARVADAFDPFLNGHVERFFLPGTGAMNILMHKTLGGGGMASLRNDSQGKAYGQMLLRLTIPVSRSIAETL
ncbi:MAG: acyclic terpene utilization AtuA family protein [Rhodobacteraceae bacterium]|nr:acyclic terpene utilization AtuA family protein [Paracoccaceae bacterium]